MAKLFIIKTGATMPSLKDQRGDFEDWILAGMEIPAAETEVVDIAADQPLPEPGSAAGIVITGSHDMVTDHRDWSERGAGWLLQVVSRGIPTLGVCYGHQLLAYALGGRVDYNPRGQEMGTTEISLLEPAFNDELLGGLPPTFKAHVCHSQSVLRLPQGAVRLAASAWDANQAFRVDDCAWGVQFHPEFDAHIMRAYAAGETLPAGNEIVEAPFSARVLKRFALIVSQKQARAGKTPS
ncbi:MAG TPA: glutamine amidotransferase [Spirochaetia bacterium]|nr:glutamine amidotransferase [Spirochaetia bacterium]